MRGGVMAVILFLTACTATPEAPPSLTHDCVAIPNGLVECGERE
ncbi:hypothetical protein [Pseudotabrizicola alkalilacus]|nr:hypothetical protein [Pseudotabrizicola alkalilacus]